MRSITDSYRQFLCHCLRLDGYAARELAQTGDWSWEQLFQTATDEDVLPTLAAVLNEGVDICAPPEISDFLSAVLELNRQRNQHIWQDLKATARLLNGVGIEPVLLKGAAYVACGVYPDPGARYLLDLDLLVPEPQLDDAVRHLIDNGYVEDQNDRFGRFRHHRPPLRRDSVPLELHHKLGLGPCQSMLPAKEVLENASELELDGIRVFVPSATHLVTHLVMHSQIQHHYNERIWPPLRASYDLLRLQCHYRQSIEWTEVERRFKAAGRIDLLLLHLIDVRDALGVQPVVDCQLSPLGSVRCFRRCVLRRFPALRYLDPVHMFSTVFIPRLRLLRSVLAQRAGFKVLLSQVLSPGIYHRIFWDIIRGVGR